MHTSFQQTTCELILDNFYPKQGVTVTVTLGWLDSTKDNNYILTRLFRSKRSNNIEPTGIRLPAYEFSQMPKSWQKPFFIYCLVLATQAPVRLHVCRIVCASDAQLAINILTSTTNASLIITDFLAMVAKMNSHIQIIGRGWTRLENDFNMTCRWRVIPMTSNRLNLHMTALCINRL